LMMDRTTSFVVGALTCLVAGASFVTIHLGDAGAADDCLAAPKSASSPGQHWYYRIDRATQRHCWYLGDASKAVARVAKSAPAHRTDLTDSDREAALARSAANVHAEMPTPQMSRDDDAKFASVVPVAPEGGKAAPGEAAGEPVKSTDVKSPDIKSPDIWRALDAANFKPTTSEPLQPSSSATASATMDATPDNKSEPDSASAASSAPVAAPALAPPPVSAAPPAAVTRMEAPAMGRATSLSALFLAAFGALVFVTLATGLAYFFTDGMRDRQPNGGVSPAQDWPPEPFRLPSSLKLLAHGSFVDESAPVPSRARWVDVPREGPTANVPRDNDVHQIEQLLTRAVRRSETLRGRVDGLTSPGSA
jgi:hypothetical protein